MFLSVEDEDDVPGVFAVQVFLQGHVGVLVEAHQFEVADEVEVEDLAAVGHVAHAETGGGCGVEAQGVEFADEGGEGRAVAVVHGGFFEQVGRVAECFARGDDGVVVVQEGIVGGDAEGVVCGVEAPAVSGPEPDVAKCEAFIDMANDVLPTIIDGEVR